MMSQNIYCATDAIEKKTGVGVLLHWSFVSYGYVLGLSPSAMKTEGSIKLFGD